MTFQEIIARIVELVAAAREESSRIRASIPAEQRDLVFTDADFAPRPRDQELRVFLANQPIPLRYSLVALMYLGRGDFSASDFDEQCDKFRDSFKPDWVVGKLMEKAHLDKFLTDGLAKLLKERGDVDALAN